MRVLVLVTYTDCENKYKSLESVGYDVRVLQYDNLPHNRHSELIERAKLIKPDAIVFIGAVEYFHNRPVPRPDILCKIREIAPFIHMCSDAGDEPWWEWIETYYRHDCFDLQISIDGNYNTPINQHDNGLVLLTPVDYRNYNPPSWQSRDIKCGMVGGLGHTLRAELINSLRDQNLLQFFDGSSHAGGRSYYDMAQLMGRFKIAFNFPMTGTGNNVHVKGRIVEAGFAGCVPLELASSPTGLWFKSNVEFLQFRNVDEARRKINDTPDDILERMARDFQDRVFREHHPRVFWRRVFKKVGFNDEDLPNS